MNKTILISIALLLSSLSNADCSHNGVSYSVGKQVMVIDPVFWNLPTTEFNAADVMDYISYKECNADLNWIESAMPDQISDDSISDDSITDNVHHSDHDFVNIHPYTF